MLSIIVLGGIIFCLFGLLFLWKVFNQERDVLRIWFPIAAIFTVFIWFLRYDYGNFDDKAHFYLGSAIMRTAPSSTAWIDSNFPKFEPKMIENGEDLRKRYKLRFVQSFNYVTTSSVIWLADNLLSFFDKNEKVFDLRRAAVSVALGLFTQWAIAFVIFLLVIKWLADRDRILLDCFIVGAIIWGIMIFYWDAVSETLLIHFTLTCITVLL